MSTTDSKHGIVGPDGRPISGKGVILTPTANVFEGCVTITLYDDAIAGRGTCAHCLGPIEGVLRFPRGYRLMDDPDRIADARGQLCKKLKREHHCAPRLDGPKQVAADFLRKFE